MLFVDERPRRSDADAPSLAQRQPAIYATRLVRTPSIVNARSYDSFRAAHVHAPAPACIELKCERCADLEVIGRMVQRSDVALHPMLPPFPPPPASKERK